MKLRGLFQLPLLCSLFCLSVNSLVIPVQRRTALIIHRIKQSTHDVDDLVNSNVEQPSSRREFLNGVFGLASTVTFVLDPYHITKNVANAIPMISTNEFNTIIRDSARSIEMVEFSGPKSEIVKIILVDGTTIGINDVIESSTDPRSPLKVAAMCKANQIPYKFTNIEAMLNAAPRRKKAYTNERVLQAAEKEKEKAIRMAEDELLRQQELRDMQ